MPFALLIPLLISCQMMAVAANYAVLDIYSSDEDCSNHHASVQASLRREVGVCWNLPPAIPHPMPSFLHGKKSYRIESCANTYPFFSVSVTGLFSLKEGNNTVLM
jgi:hypothetical protein